MIAKHKSLLTETEKSQLVTEIRRLVDNDVQSQAPQIRKGKHCYNYVQGNIFTDTELQEIEEAEKVAVQTTEGMVKLSAIMGHIMRTSKEGIVIGNGPEDAAPAELRNSILKDDISVNSGTERIKFQVTQDVLVTGVPTWAWIDNTDPDDVAKPGLSVTYQPWDSVIPSAEWRDPNLRDLHRITRIRQMTYAQVSEVWFDGQNAEAIRQYEKISYGPATRDEIKSDFLLARTGNITTSAGLVNVFETLQFIYTDFRVSMGTDPDDTAHLPITMTDEEAAQHAQETGRTIVTAREKVLWSTTWTNTGLLLEHGPCWFQAGGFPAACFVPALVDGSWCGVIEFAVDVLKMLAYLRTEQLQGVRTVNNNVHVMVEGAVTDKAQARREMAKAGGLVELAAGVGSDGIKPLSNQRENQAFNDAIGSGTDLLDRLTLERNAEGGSQASQESSKAIGARMDANLTKLSYFIQGMAAFERQLNRTLVRALPYGYPEYRAIRLRDPNNGTKIEELNKPVEMDWMGEVTRSINNLALGDWDWVFTEADNSVSGRDQARAVFSEFMKNFGNMTPEALETIAIAYPSTDVQNLGKMLKEKREAVEKAPPPSPPAKISATLDLASLGAEALREIAVKANLLSPKPPPPPQQGPEGMPEGEMPPMAEEGGMPPMEMNPAEMPNEMEM